MQLHRVISNNKRWIPQIDGLRFVAITQVLFGHIFGETYNGHGGLMSAGINPEYDKLWTFPLTRSGYGVELFFVISGFILARPFFESYVHRSRAVSIQAFYLRRVTRLEPPYILCLLIYFAAWSLGPSKVVGSQTLGLIASIFYVGNFFPHLPHLNFVTWTLEVEIQFYLLVPLLANVFRIAQPLLRRSVLLLAIIGLALPAFASAKAHYFWLPGAMCFFLTGFLLADLQPEAKQWGSPLAWDIVSLLCIPVYLFTPPNYTNLPICIVLFVVFVSSLQGRLAKRVAGAKPIAIIGGMCYSIYLMHALILSVLFRFTNRLLTFHNAVRDYAVQLLVLLPAVLALSFVYYLLVERPCMDPLWPQKLAAWVRRVQAPARQEAS